MADDAKHVNELVKKKKKSKKEKQSSELETTTSSSQLSDTSTHEKSKRRSESSAEEQVYSKKKAKIELANGDVKFVTPIPTKREKWSFEQEQVVLDKVQGYVAGEERLRGPKKYVFLRHIDWEKIAFGEFTAEDVHARFNTITNRVRKMRTASEILHDAKELHESSRVKKNNQTKVVDPDLPKKPISTFFQFVSEKRPRLAERHPDLKNTEVTVKLGKKWNKLSEEKKEKYVSRFQEQNEEYKLNLIEYLKSHNPGVSPPKSAYDLWAEETAKVLKNERPDISDNKLKKKLKRTKWEQVEEEEKAKWEVKEKKEIKNFKVRVNKERNKVKPKPGSPAQE